MDLRQLHSTLTDAEWQQFARRAGRAPGYLYLCALKHRNVSPKTAKDLVRVDARLTLHELRPDIWDAAQ